MTSGGLPADQQTVRAVLRRGIVDEPERGGLAIVGTRRVGVLGGAAGSRRSPSQGSDALLSRIVQQVHHLGLAGHPPAAVDVEHRPVHLLLAEFA